MTLRAITSIAVVFSLPLLSAGNDGACPFPVFPPDLPADQATTPANSRLNAPFPRPLAPTIGKNAVSRTLLCAVRAKQIPIAPADRGALHSRFRSLAAFERRPTSRRTCYALSERAGVRNPAHMQLSRRAPRNLASTSAYPPKPDAVAGAAQISGLCQMRT